MAIQELSRSSSGIPQFHFDECVDTAIINLLAGHPVMIIGAPATGKSTAARVVAKKMNWHFNMQQPIGQDQCDIRGLPNRKGEYTEFFPMDTFFPKEPTLLCLDEILQARPKLQLAYMQPINERNLGGRKIADHLYFVGTGNRKEDKCSVESSPKHLQNRFFWMELLADNDSWLAWGHKAGIDSRILACAANHEDFIHGFDVNNPSPAYCTPRTLEYLSNARDLMGERGASVKLEKLAMGWIGQSAALKLMAHIEYADQCKSPEEIFADPESVDCEKPGPVFAMVHSCISNIVRDERISQ